MTESVLLELTNGGLGWMSFCALVIFLRYMYRNFDEGYKFLTASIALSTIWTGTVLIRWPLWHARYNINQGEAYPVPNDLILIGSMISIIGYLCVIRVFSEEKWAWKISAFGGVVFLTLSYLKLLPI